MKTNSSFHRIAVTGSQGQLGREIAKISGEYSKHQFSFLSRKDFPLEDLDKVTKWLEQHPVDIFVHCAAYTAVDKAESDKENAYKINAAASGQIASVLSKTKSRLIYISTDYVFEGNSINPLKEDAVTNPINVYGASKLEGERLVQKNNPDSQIIRTSWLYSEFGNNFLKTMVQLMKDRQSIKVVSDQKGSPTYAGDLARVIMDMLDTDFFNPGIYHFSNDGEATWYEFALEIKKLTNSPCEIFPISTSEYPTAAKRPAYSLLDTSKIKRDYGLIIPNWQTSLAYCIEQLKNRGV